MVNKKENSILERIEQDIKEIKELLKNPKRLLEGEKQILYNPNDPITEGQIWKIKEDLGINNIDNIRGLTKGEASKIISEHLKKPKENKFVKKDEELPDY